MKLFAKAAIRCYIIKYAGEMAEWSKAAVSKIAVGATSPRVQIPLSPPFFLQKNGERRRKSSLHAFVQTKALHLKPKVFFTSSPNSREDLLACPAIARRATADEVAPLGHL